MRMNSEIFFETMPTESPTFKRRTMLSSFNRVEDADYLAEEPIEDQKAKKQAAYKTKEVFSSRMRLSSGLNLKPYGIGQAWRARQSPQLT